MATRMEFLKAYWECDIKSMSEGQLDNILSYVDRDQNGFIEFHEFVAASVFPEDILQPEVLKQAFNDFDADGSGAIELGELRAIFSDEQEILEEDWNAMVAGVDEDGSGEISLEEFIVMMKNYFGSM